ncbi:DUF1826 domain-containing protein [Falsiruegeria litorea]|uniref:DUF1826 domain-containing protein n=1 Tax=Falsiruegeria litorea TaxID=1280831 RepID=UPI00333FCC97
MTALDVATLALRVPTGVTIANTVSGLSAIRDAGCTAVILSRQPPPQIQPWLNALEPEQLPRARVILRADRVKDALCSICETSGVPKAAARSLPIDDIAAFALHFSDLMNVQHLRLRLDVVTTNACRKFHIDAVTARLVCTYRGQTTQLGEAELGCDPDVVISVPQSCPVVLRGTNWPSDARTRILHRSPPIEGSGESRLLLVLDPIYDLEEEA